MCFQCSTERKTFRFPCSLHIQRREKGIDSDLALWFWPVGMPWFDLNCFGKWTLIRKRRKRRERCHFGLDTVFTKQKGPARIVLYHGEVEASVLCLYVRKSKTSRLGMCSAKQKVVGDSRRGLTSPRRTGYEERQVRRAMSSSGRQCISSRAHRPTKRPGRVQYHGTIAAFNRPGPVWLHAKTSLEFADNKNLEYPSSSPKELREVFVWKMKMRPETRRQESRRSVTGERQTKLVF